MGYPGRKQKRGNRLTWIVSLLLLLLAGIAALFLGHVRTMLPVEQAAFRWAYGDTRFGQVTAFFPVHNGLTQAHVHGMMGGIQGGLAQEGFEPAEEGQGGDFTYAYSAQGVLQVSTRDRGPVSVYTTFVGGNFFHFQTVQLISGGHLPQESTNRDLALIDEELAWQLFGAIHLVGDFHEIQEEDEVFIPQVYIQGRPFIVVGVYRPPGDFASRAAYGTGPHMFLFYDAPLEIDPLPITALQVVMPNPVSGFAKSFFEEALEEGNVPEDDFVLVNNSERFRLGALFQVLGDYGSRSMYRAGLNLPYWENAARMAEDYGALALLLLLIFLIFPVIRGLLWVIRRWRQRKWRLFAMTRRKLEERTEERKEQAWRVSGPEAAFSEETQDGTYDLEEIIRSVRESEE